MVIDELIERINNDLQELRRMVNRADFLEIYEFYNGKELIMVGTLKQIAQYTMYSESTLKNYSYPSHLKKTKYSETAPRLIKIGDRP